MSQEAQQALKVIGPAMVIAAATLSIAWQPWQRQPRIEHGYWGGAVALGLGFIAAFYFVAGTRGFQLQDRWHWLWMIANAAMALGVIASAVRANSLMRMLAGTVLAIATAVLFQPPLSAANTTVWKAGLGAAVFVLWLLGESLALRKAGALMPMTLVIVFAGLSIVLLQTRQAGYSLLAASLSSMCGAAMMIAALNPRFTFANGGMHVISAMLPALCFLGWLYNSTDVPAWPFAILLVSPLAHWIAELPALARMKSWQRASVCVVVTTIFVSIAVAWAVVVIETGAGELGY